MAQTEAAFFWAKCAFEQRSCQGHTVLRLGTMPSVTGTGQDLKNLSSIATAAAASGRRRWHGPGPGPGRPETRAGPGKAVNRCQGQCGPGCSDSSPLSLISDDHQTICSSSEFRAGLESVQQWRFADTGWDYRASNSLTPSLIPREPLIFMTRGMMIPEFSIVASSQ